ncbi:rhomboid protease ROM9 [Plasmodium sp. gorilla clade G3]|nr:rhomboid protease ROM9 [Plasmodium sp. gorilla clade G3]
MVWRKRNNVICPGSVKNVRFYFTKNLEGNRKHEKNVFYLRRTMYLNDYLFNKRINEKSKKNVCNYNLYGRRTFCRYSQDNIFNKQKKKNNEKINLMNKDGNEETQTNVLSLLSWLNLKFHILEMYKKKYIYNNILIRKYLNNIYNINCNDLKNKYLKISKIFIKKYLYIEIKEKKISYHITKTFTNMCNYKNYLINNIVRKKFIWTDIQKFLKNIKFNYKKTNIFLLEKISSLYKNKSNINIIYYKNMFLYHYKLSPVTYTLILLHIFVYFLWNIAEPSRKSYNYYYINNFKHNNINKYTTPLLCTDTMYKYFSCSLQNLREKKLYTLITNLISHNTIHSFLLNTISLYYIGTALETIIQSRNFFITYLISGILSSYIQILYHKNNYNNIYVFGASGSISSILTTYTFMYPSQNIYLYGILALPLALFSSLYFLNEIYCVLSDRQDNTGHIAHLTGMGLGLIYYYFFIKKGRLLR